MPYEYVNRRGERYYLLQGKTKTGKAKYYVSRKPDGTPVEAVPDGFEIHENPERGIVSVRKIRPSRLLPAERESLAEWTGQLSGLKHVIVDVDGDSMVIYTPNTDPTGAAQRLIQLFGGSEADRAEHEDWIIHNATYTAMLRFTLTDENARLFRVERWCFRGGIDGWFFLARGKPLERLAQHYLPHLGRESFFELM